MGTLISVLIIVVAVFLILIVLVQNPKGGGLSSSFSSSNQVMGVRKTADFLEKATWTLAIGLLLLSLSTSIFMKNNAVSPDSQETIESATKRVATEKAGEMPVAPPPSGMQNNIAVPDSGR